MHFRYSNNFNTDCDDFAGTDEIIFTIILCALSKTVENTARLSDVNTAISHFRDHGRALHHWLYSVVGGAWGSCARADPPIAMLFVNDSVDEVPTQAAAKARRLMAWNAVMTELRFMDRVEIEPDTDCSGTLPLPPRPDLHALIRQTIGPGLRDRLHHAIWKAMITPEVLMKMAELPLGEDNDLPDCNKEQELFWLMFFPYYLDAVPREYLDYLGI